MLIIKQCVRAAAVERDVDVVYTERTRSFLKAVHHLTQTTKKMQLTMLHFMASVISSW